MNNATENTTDALVLIRKEIVRVKELKRDPKQLDLSVLRSVSQRLEVEAAHTENVWIDPHQPDSQVLTGLYSSIWLGKGNQAVIFTAVFDYAYKLTRLTVVEPITSRCRAYGIVCNEQLYYATRIDESMAYDLVSVNTDEVRRKVYKYITAH